MIASSPRVMITAMDTAPAFIQIQGVPLLTQVFNESFFTDRYLLRSLVYRLAYLPRSRWRISSARVFMTKVNISSTSAARNSTR